MLMNNCWTKVFPWYHVINAHVNHWLIRTDVIPCLYVTLFILIPYLLSSLGLRVTVNHLFRHSDDTYCDTFRCSERSLYSTNYIWHFTAFEVLCVTIILSIPTLVGISLFCSWTENQKDFIVTCQNKRAKQYILYDYWLTSWIFENHTRKKKQRASLEFLLL